MEPDRTGNPIDYGPPAEPVTASRVFAGVLSVPAAIGGVPATVFGAAGVVAYLFLERGHTADRAANAFSSAVLLVIGAGALFLAFRWARHALGRDRSGDDGAADSEAEGR